MEQKDKQKKEILQSDKTNYSCTTINATREEAIYSLSKGWEI